MGFNFNPDWLIEQIRKFQVWFGEILRNLDQQWRQTRAGRILTNPLTVIFLGIVIVLLIFRISFLDSNLQDLQLQLELSNEAWLRRYAQERNDDPAAPNDFSEDSSAGDPSSFDLRKEELESELNTYEKQMQELEAAKKQR